MKPTVKKSTVAAALLLVPLLMSGCIVWPCSWCDYDRAPRMAVVYVHVYDYYTCAPISWAAVALYEESWWDWDYCGSWPVSPSGSVAVPAGYMYDDGPGPDERNLGLRVSAAGYYSEWYELELEYWYPTETLHFYLLPWGYRDGGEDPQVGEPEDLPESERPPDRVMVGEPRDGTPAGN
jgi:hypothetical protein